MHYSVQTEIYSQTQLCERLRHLTQFSSHLLLVSGEAGSGKSTILQTYLDSDFNQKTIAIRAQTQHDAAGVREQILQQITYDGRFNPQLTLLEALPVLASQIEHEITICIDDAQLLPESIIAEFIQLVEFKLQNRISININLILFADIDWVTKVMTKFAKSATNILELEVTALDPQAALQFVEQQFSQAGYKPTFVNQDAINRQIEACQGNPAALTLCAQAIMRGEVYTPEKAAVTDSVQGSGNAKRSFYLAAIIASLLLIGGGVTFLYDAYQNEQASSEAARNNPTDAELNDTMTAQPVAEASEPKLLASNWDDELPDIEKTITLTKGAEPETEDKTRVVVDDAAVNKIIAKQNTKVQAQLVVAPQPIIKNKGFLTEKALIMVQPAKNYTFQIAGLSRPELLERYLNEHQLTEQIYTYQTLRENKPWYVVLYGSFSSVAQANAAKSKLPAKVQKAQPWMKTFSQIQREL
ncbi:MAG: DamX protein [Moritella sp.]